MYVLFGYFRFLGKVDTCGIYTAHVVHVWGPSIDWAIVVDSEAHRKSTKSSLDIRATLAEEDDGLLILTVGMNMFVL